MTGYVDAYSNNIEALHRRLPRESSLHLGRSCFAKLMLDTYTRARNEGESIESFQGNIGQVLDSLNLPILDEIDAANTLPGKRQPSLRESFDATLDRFKVIENLDSIFGDSATAATYGGSMKYGPFMNVRSGANASDIDLVVTTPDRPLDELKWQRLMETALIDERDKLTFLARIGLQKQLVEKDEIDIMSQRFGVSDGQFTISTHFIPEAFMNEAYPQELPALPNQTRHRYVRDYKERPFERPHVVNYDMQRNQHDIAVYNRPTTGGFIASNPAYSVVEGNHYVPGMYQNLVLPDAKIAFDTNGVATDKFAAFSRAIAAEERREQLTDPEASIQNTEPRKSILPLPTDDIV